MRHLDHHGTDHHHTAETTTQQSDQHHHHHHHHHLHPHMDRMDDTCDAHERDDSFSRETAGLAAAKAAAIVELHNGDVFELTARPVRKQIGGATVRMLGYNGSIPGPTFKVAQGSEVTVAFTNETDLETTVHWHGLRLQNEFDGVPHGHPHHGMQRPVTPGGCFRYQVRFPDPGVYWYHPHIREDYAQEMGLYGTIVVFPSDPAYWAPVNREIVLTLDDILIDGDDVAPFSRTESNRTAMGRFGNVMLVNGETECALDACVGEVVRLYLTNTANVRIFSVRIPGARMKLVGRDHGRVEREAFVEEVTLAPSERVVVDVLFERAGECALEHHTPERTYPLATIRVCDQPAEPSYEPEFRELRRCAELEAERARIEADFERDPDKTLALVGEMPGMAHHSGHEGHGDHEEHEEHEEHAGHAAHGGHGAHEAQAHHSAEHGRHAAHAGHGEHSMHGGHGGDADAIEWEDTMPAMNERSTPRNMLWKLIDRATGDANHDIWWSFRVGDRVKIRIVNVPDSDHPMQHPIHFHGQRFLVLSRDGVRNDTLAWKDTELVAAGQTTDLLVEMSNPGIWMSHCHIAEHLEGGMMFSFVVEES